MKLCNKSGVLAWETGRAECALEALLIALERNPKDRDTVLNCADVLKAFGNISEARMLLQRYLQSFPNDSEAYQMFENTESLCLAA